MSFLELEIVRQPIRRCIGVGSVRHETSDAEKFCDERDVS